MRSILFKWSFWEFVMNFGKDNSKRLFFLEDGCEIETTELADWIIKKVTLIHFFVAVASVKDVRARERGVCNHIIFIGLK